MNVQKRINPQEEESKELSDIGFKKRNQLSIQEYSDFLDELDQSLKIELLSLRSELEVEIQKSQQNFKQVSESKNKFSQGLVLQSRNLSRSKIVEYLEQSIKETQMKIESMDHHRVSITE